MALCHCFRHHSWESKAGRMATQIDLSWPHEGVAQIVVDSGARNFMTWKSMGRLHESLVTARDGGARVVIIASGVDGYFFAHGHLGDNVASWTGGAASGDPRNGLRVQKELDTGPMVSIAAIDGQAWGGGAELAWSCDLRVASERATFAQVEAMLGVTTAGGSARITHLAGEAVAKQLVLDARPIDAQEAFRLGLVHRVVAAGDALSESIEWAGWLSQRPPWALAASKRVVNGSRGKDLTTVLREETSTYVEQFSKPEVLDLARAIQARYDQGADSYDAFGLPRH